MSFVKKFFIGIGISAVSLLLSLYFADLFFASVNPTKDLPKNGFFGGKRYTWGHEVVLNSFKSRGPEPEVPKKKGMFRVLSLGDSLTWGAGLAEEERYTELAEKRLQSLLPVEEVEFINLAHAGNPLVAYRDQLFEHGDTLEPDLITIGFCVNDTQPKAQNYSPERKEFLLQNRDLWRFSRKLGRYFPALSKRFWESYMNWGESSGAYPSWPEALDRTYDKESAEWKGFDQALKEMKEWSDKRGLKTPIFIALNQGSSTVEPTYYSNPDPLLKKFIKWYDQALEAAAAHGYVTIDHRDIYIKKLDGKVLGVNKVDGHPSREENQIYGDRLGETIFRLHFNH